MRDEDFAEVEVSGEGCVGGWGGGGGRMGKGDWKEEGDR